MISNGIDIVEIERIEKALEKQSFKSFVYSSEELKELENKKAESYAAAFCAKEAFSKALGSGIDGFKLNEVRVLHNSLGAPYLSLTGNAEKIASNKGLKFALSLSHCEKYAAAVVTAYTEE